MHQCCIQSTAPKTGKTAKILGMSVTLVYNIYCINILTVPNEILTINFTVIKQVL